MSDSTLRIGSLSPIRIHTTIGSTDISPCITGIEIIESLYTPFIMGRITVVDTESIRVIKKTRMKSDLAAKVEFSFAGLEDDGITPQKEIKIDPKDYWVYKIVQGSPIGFFMQTHDIYFCHRLFFKTEAKTISKSYKKKKVSEIVEDLGTQLGITWNEVEKTDKTFNFVLPYRSVVAHISFLSPYGQREENPNDVNFMFYQELSGKHNFVSLGKLLKAEPTFGTDVSSGYVVGINRGGDFASVRKAVITHSVSDTNQYENAINGMHSSSVMTLDPSEKTWSATTFFLPDQWKKQSHLSDDPLVDPSSEFYSIVNGAFSQRFYMKSRHSHCCKEQKNGNSKIGGADDWLLKRISQIEQMNQSVVEFCTTGNSDTDKIAAGKVIFFGRKLLNESVNTSVADKDYAGSGKYLILTVVHNVAKTSIGKIEYTTSIRCSKDAIGEEH